MAVLVIDTTLAREDLSAKPVSITKSNRVNAARSPVPVTFRPRHGQGDFELEGLWPFLLFDVDLTLLDTGGAGRQAMEHAGKDALWATF